MEVALERGRADQMEAKIEAQTYRRIQDLRVYFRNGTFVIMGYTTSYYVKQLATSAVFDRETPISNEIEVV